ncbi:hypothetical protein BD410DRAFT_790156 [Rickenella mellea]|uniref:Uncharacterized protein n=1 Tax=Rickenella mellea TaxID=50990 RepID=A0A4Y7Q2T6_9AGAM|nr:hypothetical protein BD410DRAFT_790156 [Rickenella mellea]
MYCTGHDPTTSINLRSNSIFFWGTDHTTGITVTQCNRYSVVPRGCVSTLANQAWNPSYSKPRSKLTPAKVFHLRIFGFPDDGRT